MNTSSGSKRLFLRALGFVILILVVGRHFLKADAIATKPETLKLDSAKLDFGSIAVGQKSSTQSATLTNPGTSPATIASILVSGIDFTGTNDCGDHLAAGAHCMIQVTFQPAISGPRIGTVIITILNDPASPHMIVLNGAGEEPPAK
jgi:hypothetical protein